MKEWKDSFFDSYVNGNKEKAFELLKSNTPKSFLKFCNGSFNDGGSNMYLDSLNKNEIWMSSPSIFNDPFDCAINIGQENIEDQILKYLERGGIGDGFANKMKQGFNDEMKEKSILVNKNLRKQIEDVKKCLFVCCFSTDKNLKKSLMWSNYANSHQGFCIEYDGVEIFKHPNENFILMPVHYRDEYRPLWMKAFDMNDHEFQLTTAFTKSTEWKYEKEWRLLLVNDNLKEQFGYPEKIIKPKNVYIGCRGSDKLKEQLNHICMRYNIGLFEMYMEPNSFNLNYRNYNAYFRNI